MAGTSAGIPETMPRPVATAVDLRKELRRNTRIICEEGDDCRMEVIDETAKILLALKELDCEKAPDVAVPEKFKCPISKKLMVEPVILTSGQTYDRPYIEKLLKKVHQKYPEAREVLPHAILRPNNAVQELISHWCKDHGLGLPKHPPDIEQVKHAQDDAVFTDEERNHFNSLLKKMSLTLSGQKEAAKEIRQLTKVKTSYRSLFGVVPDAISKLLSPLSTVAFATCSDCSSSSSSRSYVPGSIATHPDLQEDLITTVFNMFIRNTHNMRLFGKVKGAVPLLVESLRFGNLQTRRNAAAAICVLAQIDSNRRRIGQIGALRPLVELLWETDEFVVKDVACAIFQLCILDENKEIAARCGAVGMITECLMDGMLVDDLLATLALIAPSGFALKEMERLGAATTVLNILKHTRSEGSKENSVRILHLLCSSHQDHLNLFRKEETANGTFTKLALSSTATQKPKKKASGILEMLKYSGKN